MTNEATEAALAMREMAATLAYTCDYMTRAAAKSLSNQIRALPLPASSLTTPPEAITGEGPVVSDAADKRDEALKKAMIYVERARLNLSYAKQEGVPTAAEAQSNRNSAFHDCVAAISAIEAALTGRS